MVVVATAAADDTLSRRPYSMTSVSTLLGAAARVALAVLRGARDPHAVSANGCAAWQIIFSMARSRRPLVGSLSLHFTILRNAAQILLLQLMQP